MEWRSIQRSEIPPPPVRRCKKQYGEWAAIAKLLRIAPASTAVEVDLTGWEGRNATMSAHKAAREANLRISVQVVAAKMYIVRVGQPGPAPANKARVFDCRFCRHEVRAIRANQVICGSTACFEKLQKANYRRRLARNQLRRQAA